MFQGAIVNQAQAVRDVPPIQILLMDEGGRELQRKTFNPQDNSVDAGSRTTFSGVVINPPTEARTYSVVFDVDS